MNIIKSIYTFIVGDMIILSGVLLTLGLLLLIENIEAFAPLRIGMGGILIGAVLIVLIATLAREARSQSRHSHRM